MRSNIIQQCQLIKSFFERFRFRRQMDLLQAREDQSCWRIVVGTIPGQSHLNISLCPPGALRSSSATPLCDYVEDELCRRAKVACGWLTNGPSHTSSKMTVRQ